MPPSFGIVTVATPVYGIAALLRSRAWGRLRERREHRPVALPTHAGV